MRANKIFYDLYSTSGGTMPYEEYRAWYNKNDTVYIILVDEKIITKVKRQEMFDLNLHNGCFIKNNAYNTPEQVRENALKDAERFGCVFVSPKEFMTIEEKEEEERVAKAFTIAEWLIASN